jgi:hypothetical protein
MLNPQLRPHPQRSSNRSVEPSHSAHRSPARRAGWDEGRPRATRAGGPVSYAVAPRLEALYRPEYNSTLFVQVIEFLRDIHTLFLEVLDVLLEQVAKIFFQAAE